ncbi:clavaminate synthase family protein [Dactylosporangium fulvum]|uniref:TauD/TfdA family dioxygenase n=1 Tax=Dactylosporangium fulvum TaxID=53359 RepID=A0ABY5W1F6_9ACTN|nr:guanitoxin biosynthesis L-enduracididine beta-hydroxylase GntD [Dactylosporangium fulvum]UWP83857.1 TauD/TfdA family dioxygenase [Dactylosporangium fulvum]
MVAPATLRIDADELKSVEWTIERLADEFDTVESEAFLRAVTLASHELPVRIRAELLDFKMLEPNGALLIQGLPVDDAAIGPTPFGHGQPADEKATLWHDIAFFLFASCLGDPIGWETYQQGRLLQHVAPRPGHEADQTSTGSVTKLEWHTEEAYHPFRPEYLGLMCLRNPDNVATTLAQMADLRLSAEDLALLCQERFVIRPDEAHILRRDEVPGLAGRMTSFNRIDRMNAAPEPVALIFGAEDRPYLRVDPYYMDMPEQDEFAAAFAKLCAEIETHLQDVALQPGEILFLDNWRTVHGRKAFRARYDGRDRWLKRLSLTRDLRKSRSMRASVNGRSIG